MLLKLPTASSSSRTSTSVRYIDDRLNQQQPYAAIADVEIARTRDDVRVTLHTARPGLVIGPKGAEIDKLREALEDLIDRKVTVNIVEIKHPDLSAQLVSEAISEQLRRRAAFSPGYAAALRDDHGPAGPKVSKSYWWSSGRGRVGTYGKTDIGQHPLQTLQANVDYGFTGARTTYGIVGVKVWIYRGMYGSEAEPIAQPRRTGGRR